MDEEVYALFSWEGNGEAAARKLADEYSKKNWRIVVEAMDGHAHAITQAQQNGMSHVLFFLDEERILFSPLSKEAQGMTLQILVSDLTFLD